MTIKNFVGMNLAAGLTSLLVGCIQAPAYIPCNSYVGNSQRNLDERTLPSKCVIYRSHVKNGDNLLKFRFTSPYCALDFRAGMENEGGSAVLKGNGMYFLLKIAEGNNYADIDDNLNRSKNLVSIESSSHRSVSSNASLNNEVSVCEAYQNKVSCRDEMSGVNKPHHAKLVKSLLAHLDAMYQRINQGRSFLK